ncbi:MAG: PAS domain S-box protein [Methanomicrobiaceae archaeon]|nr:PAS domain S-box protein [Methanomicrobiaceae archaeon]
MYSILLVDDEPILLTVAKAFLEKYEDLQCDTCASGPEALDRIPAASYAAVISDFEMPGMNGIDLLKAIRERYPDLPFILFTGRGREEVAIEALNHGADYYVQKGGDISAQFTDLAHKIRRAAEKTRSARRLRRLNQELSAGKERLKVTLRSIGDGVIVTDTHGLVVSLNRVAEELCGWNEQEAAGRPLTEVFCIINEKTGRACTNPVQKVLDIGGIVGLANHTALISRDGSKRAIADSAAPVCDDTGAILGVVLVFRDVTREKEAERGHLRLAAIAESTSDAIYTITPEGIIATWNRGAERIYGYAAEEVVGRHVSVVAPPELENEGITLMAKVKHGAIVEQYETYRYRKGGQKIHIALTLSTLIDAEGDFLGFSGISRDITERKQYEQRIEHLNRVLLAIRTVNQIIVEERDPARLLPRICTTLTETGGYHHAWIALYDDDRRLVVRAAAGLGDQGHLLNERFSRDSIPACARRALDSPSCISTKEPASDCRDCPLASRHCGLAAMTRRLEWEDRVYGLLSISIPPEMATDDEEQALFEEAASDIGFALHAYETERERTRAEAALFEANTKLNLLSSITRHDIINQTTGISAMIHLLRDELEGNQNGEEYLTCMQEALTSINRQISFTRDYQHMGVNRPGWQPVAALIERAAETTLPVDISLDNRTASLEIFADPMVERVFFNLLDNAVRHGGQISVIRVSSFDENGQCRIIVEDDGDGIPPDEKEAIFERGFGKNTGYGLFLARAALAITGIAIRERGEEGKGARFEIVVPAEHWRGAYPLR